MINSRINKYKVKIKNKLTKNSNKWIILLKEVIKNLPILMHIYNISFMIKKNNNNHKKISVTRQILSINLVLVQK